MEVVAMNRDFWSKRRVFITGHTGFKGSWLTHWLKRDGAEVTGFALPPPTEPSLFITGNIEHEMTSITGDVRNAAAVASALEQARPEVVVHMAAQSLVRQSYTDPVETYSTNVMGTVNVLEAVRRVGSVRVVIVVTSDKCYENSRDGHAFREEDALGGRDPYSSSKACVELVASAYRSSFFSSNGGPHIASVRAGNVIGGGDWSVDRLVPDLVRAFRAGNPAVIRHPDATRPWQHVLDALHGYRKLIEALCVGADLPFAWNFGSDESRPVRWLADAVAAHWGDSATWSSEAGEHPHEAPTLALDSTRAREMLSWKPVIDPATTVEWTATFYKRLLAGEPADALMNAEIERFAEVA